MPPLQIIYVAVSLSAGILLLGLAYRSVRHPHAGGTAFIGLMLTVALWSLMYAVELLAPIDDIALLANRIKFIGITLTPVMWVLFAGRYSGRMQIKASPQVGALFIIPTLTLLFAFTSPQWHQLMFTSSERILTAGFPTLENQYGIWWRVHILYSYGLILFGSYWMVIAALQSLTVFESQARLILLAVIVPLIGNMLTVTNSSPLPNIDLAPTLFSFSAIVFARLLQKREDTDISPISFEGVIDNLPNAVLVLDKNYRVLSTNPPARRILRQDEDALIGADVANVLPEAVSYMKTDLDETIVRDEFTISGRIVDLITAPLFDANRNHQGWVMVMQDITVRKQTEHAFMSNERRYRALFENSNDAIFIVDLDFTIIIANKQAASLLDIDLAKLLRTSVQQFIHPDERPASEDTRDRLINGDTVPLYERTFMRSDGEGVPCEVSLTLVRDAENQPLHIQMIVRNISERKRAEAFMETRIEQLGVLRQVDEEVNRTLNIDTVTSVALEAAQRLSNADAGFIALNDDDIVRISEVIGGYSPDIIGQSLNPNIGVVGRALTNLEPELVRDQTDDIDYYADLPDTVALMALPLVSQDRLVGIIVLETRARDTFDDSRFQFLQLLAGRMAVAIDNARLYGFVRRQLDEFQELYEELRDAEKLKTDMIRIANHDLQNPLSTLEGFLNLLEMDRAQFGDEHLEFFETMQSSVDRMKNILHDFLTVEQIQQRAKNFEKVDMLDPVRSAYNEYQRQASMKAQSMWLDTCEPHTAMVMVDKPQIYEAITNLIANAIKYTPDEGKIRIELTINEDERIKFAVHDTGYGIPENRQEQLFQPFYRTKTNETAHIEGTGLGLHLVKNIVERHKGEMIFESVHGEGSTFGFTLPPAPVTQPISQAMD